MKRSSRRARCSPRRASSEIEHIGVVVFTAVANLLVTNVPGPPVRIHIAGRVSSNIGLGVSLRSYGGEVRVCVSADEQRVPDPQRTVGVFAAEVAAQRAALGIG